MQNPGTELLSPLGRDVLEFNASDAYARLVVTGEGNPEAVGRLEKVAPQQLISVPVTNWPAAQALLAALWLRHDWLHRSHEIVQQEPQDLEQAAMRAQPAGGGGNNRLQPQQLREMTATLAFWHAALHRREGDFNNARYWYAKCANHPVMATLAEQGQAMMRASGASADARIITRDGWDTYALVDIVESVFDAADDQLPVQLARELQRLEWRLLFDHTLRTAVGA